MCEINDIPTWQIVSSSIASVVSIACLLYVMIERIIFIADIQDTIKKNDIQTSNEEENPLSFESGIGIFKLLPHVVYIAKWVDIKIGV